MDTRDTRTPLISLVSPRKAQKIGMSLLRYIDPFRDEGVLMATYLELKAQADKIMEPAEAARLAELQTVLAEVRARVAEYGLTPEQVIGRQRTVRTILRRQLPRYRPALPRFHPDMHEPEEVETRRQHLAVLVLGRPRSCSGNRPWWSYPGEAPTRISQAAYPAPPAPAARHPCMQTA
jgi:hypothetical protein